MEIRRRGSGCSKRSNGCANNKLNAGGFRPAGDSFASHWGLKPLALPGEDWPAADGKPMLFVCQMNLTNAPVAPTLLNVVKLIAFFVKPELEQRQEESGNALSTLAPVDWVVRTYESLDGLAPQVAPAGAPSVRKGFECRWKEFED
jgi:hypothetical protein